MLLLQMSHYLTVPAKRQETPPVRKVFFQPGQSKSQFKARFYENENYVQGFKVTHCFEFCAAGFFWDI